MLYDELKDLRNTAPDTVPENISAIRKELMSMTDPHIPIWNRFATFIERVTGVKQDPDKIRIATYCQRIPTEI